MAEPHGPSCMSAMQQLLCSSACGPRGSRSGVSAGWRGDRMKGARRPLCLGVSVSPLKAAGSQGPEVLGGWLPCRITQCAPASTRSAPCVPRVSRRTGASSPNRIGRQQRRQCATGERGLSKCGLDDTRAGEVAQASASVNRRPSLGEAEKEATHCDRRGGAVRRGCWGWRALCPNVLTG